MQPMSEEFLAECKASVQGYHDQTATRRTELWNQFAQTVSPELAAQMMRELEEATARSEVLGTVEVSRVIGLLDYDSLPGEKPGSKITGGKHSVTAFFDKKGKFLKLELRPEVSRP